MAISQQLRMFNAALFSFVALQHAGVAIGPFHEPHIFPAAVVETICGLSLAWGGARVLMGASGHWRTAFVANSIALGGVLLGMAALAAGRGPRTASNDFYHHIMLILIAASFSVLVWKKRALSRT